MVDRTERQRNEWVEGKLHTSKAHTNNALLAHMALPPFLPLSNSPLNYELINGLIHF
jgi:hypothetical protein